MELPLPQSEQPDIYDYKFDKSLNRNTKIINPILQSSSIYNAPFTTDMAGNIVNTIVQFVPSGAILMFGGSTAPAGYLLCDGTAYSRQAYTALFTAIGTAYGTGDGSTTFNVPNFQGRGPMGRNAGTFTPLGTTGGEETHTLTVAQLPAHTHTINVNNVGSGVSSVVATVASQGTNAYTTDSGSGGGQAHNVLDPYLVVNFIIKF